MKNIRNIYELWCSFFISYMICLPFKLIYKDIFITSQHAIESRNQERRNWKELNLCQSNFMASDHYRKSSGLCHYINVTCHSFYICLVSVYLFKSNRKIYIWKGFLQLINSCRIRHFENGKVLAHVFSLYLNQIYYLL